MRVAIFSELLFCLFATPSVPNLIKSKRPIIWNGGSTFLSLQVDLNSTALFKSKASPEHHQVADGEELAGDGPPGGRGAAVGEGGRRCGQRPAGRPPLGELQVGRTAGVADGGQQGGRRLGRRKWGGRPEGRPPAGRVAAGWEDRRWGRRDLLQRQTNWVSNLARQTNWVSNIEISPRAQVWLSGKKRSEALCNLSMGNFFEMLDLAAMFSDRPINHPDQSLALD